MTPLVTMQGGSSAASQATDVPEAMAADSARPGFTHMQPLLSPFQDTELQQSFHSLRENGHAAGRPEVMRCP